MGRIIAVLKSMGKARNRKMNKKQLIAIWVMGILISIAFIAASFFDLIDTFPYGNSSIRLLMYYLQTVIPIVTVGSLLIYSLRDNK